MSGERSPSERRYRIVRKTVVLGTGPSTPHVATPGTLNRVSEPFFILTWPELLAVVEFWRSLPARLGALSPFFTYTFLLLVPCGQPQLHPSWCNWTFVGSDCAPGMETAAGFGTIPCLSRCRDVSPQTLSRAFPKCLKVFSQRSPVE
jgi:hypothetical protein